MEQWNDNQVYERFDEILKACGRGNESDVIDEGKFNKGPDYEYEGATIEYGVTGGFSTCNIQTASYNIRPVSRYKRIVHFKRLLRDIMGVTYSVNDLPDTYFNYLADNPDEEIHTGDDVRRVFKKIKHNNYRQVATALYWTSGYKYPIFTNEEYYKILNTFKRVEYLLRSKTREEKGRRNFVQYATILRLICGFLNIQSGRVDRFSLGVLTQSTLNTYRMKYIPYLMECLDYKFVLDSKKVNK